MRWVREDTPFLIARATGTSLSGVLEMSAPEYREWERHFATGLAPEVWTPLLLAILVDMVSGAFGGGAVSKKIPWFAEDDLMRTPAQINELKHQKVVASAWRRAREALAGMRLG